MKTALVLPQTKITIIMKIYVATKITGIPWSVVKSKLAEAKAYLLAIGYEPVIPTELPGNSKDTLWEESMKICIRALVDCDAIALLEDWTNSRGARLEQTIAIRG